MTFKSKMEKLSPPTNPANKKFQRVEVDVQIEDGILSPPTHPANKKTDFKKADYQFKIEDTSFVQQNNILKENQLYPTGVQANPFGG